MLLSGVNNIPAKLREVNIRISNKLSVAKRSEEVEVARNFLVIGRPHRRRNPKGENIREGSGKDEHANGTDRPVEFSQGTFSEYIYVYRGRVYT